MISGPEYRTSIRRQGPRFQVLPKDEKEDFAKMVGGFSVDFNSDNIGSCFVSVETSSPRVFFSSSVSCCVSDDAAPRRAAPFLCKTVCCASGARRGASLAAAEGLNRRGREEEKQKTAAASAPGEDERECGTDRQRVEEPMFSRSLLSEEREAAEAR